jgi:hypothetical protein
LSTLIDTMEQVSRPELRSQPCDRLVLVAVHAQLSRPASPYRPSLIPFQPVSLEPVPFRLHRNGALDF